MDSKFLPIVTQSLATKYAVGIEKVNVKEFAVSSGSAKGDGYVCVLKAFNGKADVEGQGEVNFELMGKVLPENEQAALMVKSIGAMDREIAFYIEILPELNVMLPSEEIACPKAYFGDVKIGFVMENLKPRGYGLKGQKVGLNTIQVKQVLNELAKLHATSYNFIENKVGLEAFKSKYNGLFTGLSWVPGRNKTMEDIMKAFIVIQTAIIKEECKDEHVLRRALKFQDNSFENAEMIVKPEEGGFNVLCHHDCWCNNMMFNEKDEIKLVDWQICRRSRPTTDLGYLFGSSTSPQWRKGNLKDMLDFYHEKLEHYLKCVDINIEECYPKHKFLNEFKSTQSFLYYCGLMHTVVQFANPNDENALDVEKLETQQGGHKLYQEAQIKAAKSNPELCKRIIDLCFEAIEADCI